MLFFFQSSEVHQVSWFLCLESYRVKTGPVDRTMFFSGGSGRKSISLLIQVLAEFGPCGCRNEVPSLAGCQPGAVPNC